MIPLYSVPQIREADSFAISRLGIPGLVLMENASISIFNSVKEENYFSKESIIGFVCGKGNNGGDGFAVARHFVNSGNKVVVVHLGDESEMAGDTLTNFKILKETINVVKNSIIKKFKSIKDLKELENCDLIFDALLGTGSKGEIKEPYLSIISELNKLKSAKVAVDIPTGLDADTGYGETIFNADLTITLAELKKGLFINKGAANCGKVIKGYIGVPDEFFNNLDSEDYLIEPEDAFYSLPIRKKDLHKYSAGKVLTIGGSGNLPGAAILTSSAVLNSGAGASILCFPESIKTLAQSKVAEVIINPYDDEGTEIFKLKNVEELKKRFEWMDVLAIGPGLGRSEETIEAVLETIKINSAKKIVIDADGVFALSNNRYQNINLKKCILTPHYGEFANLINISGAELQKDIFQYGKEFVKSTGSFLILKGAPTVIFNPSGEAFINTTGNNGMAKFGTGDVLTGVVAGFLTQSDSTESAVIAGVYIHSLAADLLLNELTEYGISASAISVKIPAAIKFLRDSIV